MPKRVFIIHGWGGSPDEGWFPWLATQLQSRGFEVQVPAMPDADEPAIEDWVAFLRRRVGKSDENTYFVGHSIGCQAIMRYIETLGAEERAGGAVFVAGWFTLMVLETDEEKEIARPWLETPINTAKIRQKIGKMFAIFSDNDPVVPAENIEMFEERLGARTFIEDEKGHLSGSDNVTVLPSALNAALEMAN